MGIDLLTISFNSLQNCTKIVGLNRPGEAQETAT